MSVEAYTKYVEEIQTLLSSDADPTEEELTRLHERYSEAVESMNARLRRCDELLKNGHRTEAIQLSENDPNLLEVIPILDFPEVEIWRSFVKDFKFRPPPQLFLDIAADLNSAYVTEKPLENLMQQHRLLALARAPLRQRIDVLQQIAQLDGDNPIWEEDIQQFERARRQEIRNEIAAARRRFDTAALGELESELTSSHWSEKPPQAIVAAAQQALRKAQEYHARIEMEDLKHRICDAHSEFDIDSAEKLRGRWDELAPLGMRGADDPLRETVEPAFDWLERELNKRNLERQYQESIAALDEALDSDAARSVLTSKHSAVENFRRGVPDHLERRYREQIGVLDRMRVVRGYTVAGVIVALILAVGALVFVVGDHKKYESKVANACEYLKSLIDGGRLKDAEQYVNTLAGKEERIYRDPHIRELEDMLKAAIKAQLQLAENIQRLEQDARGSIAAVADWDDVETAGQAFAELADGEREVQRLFAAAAKLTDEEQRRAAELVSTELNAQIDEQRDRAQEIVDLYFKVQHDEFMKSVADPNALSTSELQQTLKQGQNLYETPHVSTFLKQAELPIKLERLRSTFLRRSELQREMESIARITDQVGDADRFKNALESFVEAYRGKSKRCRDFEKVADDVELWKKHSRLGDLAMEWSSRDIGRLSPEEAARMLRDYQDIASTPVSFPQQEKFAALIPAMEAIAARSASGEKLENSLRQFLSSPLLSEVQYLRTTDGNQYYFQDAPVVASVVNIKYVTDVHLDTKDEKNFLHAEVANERVAGRTDEWLWISPQARYAMEAAQILDRLDQESWETVLMRMVRRLFHPVGDEVYMDPILRVRILKEVLDTGIKGSYSLKQTLGRQQAKIDGHRLNFFCWMIPNDTDAEELDESVNPQVERRNAQNLWRILSNDFVGREELIHRQIQSRLNVLVRPDLGEPFQWVGWLARNEMDEMACHSKDQNWKQQMGNLFVLNSGDASEVSYEPIGETAGGDVTLRIPQEIREGQPVFFRQTVAAGER